jgi:SAM-dependent methyltransferase
MFFLPGYLANLVPSWIPSLDGVEAKLIAGAKVADVGCGLGASTVLMAQAYPASRFAASDYHGASIELARKRAAEAGAHELRGRGRPGVPWHRLRPGRHDMSNPVGVGTCASRSPTTAPG